MKDVFQAVPVTENIHWVGAIDWSVRDFHGYLTSRGTTYNAYLLQADKTVLFDTVKAPFADEMLARVASVVDPSSIDYIISNHSEPDHSGSLRAAIDAIEPEKVFASANGVKALENHFGLGDRCTAVADGESLDLGGMTVTFLETKMCHWPDSMVSYIPESATLISQDAFGMHLASYARFADQIDPAILDYEAAKYYANILLPLSSFVGKAIDRVVEMGIAIDRILPDHGPIWRNEPMKIVQDYARWATQPRTRKAVVVFDTMWNSTDKLARAMGEGLAAGGASPVRLLPLSSAHRSDVATELLDAGAVVFGAPTINKQMFPTMADCLSYAKGLQPKGLKGAVFGSFGWGGESTKLIAAEMDAMGIEMLDEPTRARYVPDADTLTQAYQTGVKLGQAIAHNEPGK